MIQTAGSPQILPPKSIADIDESVLGFKVAKNLSTE
jgi:hypothetical protein